MPKVKGERGDRRSKAKIKEQKGEKALKTSGWDKR